jgi:hypothetical protein
MRRVKRLHRRAIELARQKGTTDRFGFTRLNLTAALTPTLAASWKVACREIVVTHRYHPDDKVDTLITVTSEAFTTESKAQATSHSREWVRKFRHNLREWNLEGIRGAVKQPKSFSDPPGFTAAEMKEEWRAHWCQPHAKNYAQGWQRQAELANLEPSVAPPWREPELKKFLTLAAECTGSAGLDGWDHSEVRALAQFAPWLLKEFFDFFSSLTRAAPGGTPAQAIEAIYAWRIVGIPKRNSEESRPIAVASLFVRIWHKLLLDQMPETPHHQWSERGVVRATADWLTEDPVTRMVAAAGG